MTRCARRKLNGQPMFNATGGEPLSYRQTGNTGELEFQPGTATATEDDAMKKYFAQLRPLERRLAVGVLVILFLVLNYVFIWPHFSDWGNLRQRGWMTPSGN